MLPPKKPGPFKDTARVEKDLSRLAGSGSPDAKQPVVIGDGDDAITGDRLLVYGTDRGIRIDVRYQGDTLWMTQKQMSDLFGRDVSVISRHVANVIAEEELPEAGNLQKMQIGTGKPTTLYSVDMVIPSVIGSVPSRPLSFVCGPRSA